MANLAQNSMSMSVSDVASAKATLAKMRRSLSKWLEYRDLTDQVAYGQKVTGKPNAQQIAMNQVAQRPATERPLAKKLYGLLSTLDSDAALPDPSSPNAAVALAQYAITGQMPNASGSLSGLGGGPPWMWPALIVGGLLVAVTTAIHSAADVAKDREEKACIEAGACTDYGFWFKAAAILGIGWFVWKELGVGEHVKKRIKS